MNEQKMQISWPEWHLNNELQSVSSFKLKPEGNPIKEIQYKEAK